MLLGLGLPLTKSWYTLILYACDIYIAKIERYKNSIATSQNYLGVYDEEKGHSSTMPM